MPIESNPTRILFVATSGGEGGIERYSVRLAVLLQARGVPVLYACRPGGFLERHCVAYGVPTVPWEVRNSGDLGAAVTLARLLRAHAIDIVHVHSRRDYVPAVLGAKSARRRLVLHAHLIRRLGEPPLLAGRFFQWGADGVIVVSQAVRDYLRAEHHFPDAFVHLLPNGVDTAAFAAADGVAQRRAWGIAPEILVVGMMGRLGAKGQEMLLQIGPRLVEQFPDLQFVLVGPEGSDGDRDRLFAQAEALGIAARLHLPGMTEDVPAAMAAFDVLAHLPSDESFGLVLAEAMAAGCPPVATDIGGCREVVQNGVTGILVPLGDAEALTDALSRLLGDPTLCRRMGDAGRHRVESQFSLDQQVTRLHHLYRRFAPRLETNLIRRRLVYTLTASFALLALAFTAFCFSRIPHSHVHHIVKNFHSHLGASTNSHVPRRRGRAAPTAV